MLCFNLDLGRAWGRTTEFGKKLKEERKSIGEKSKGMMMRDLDIQRVVEYSELPAWYSKDSTILCQDSRD